MAPVVSLARGGPVDRREVGDSPGRRLPRAAEAVLKTAVAVAPTGDSEITGLAAYPEVLLMVSGKRPEYPELAGQYFRKPHGF